MVSRLTITSTADDAKVQWLPVHFGTKVEKAVKNRSIPLTMVHAFFE
jgi:hypothetical protein